MVVDFGIGSERARVWWREMLGRRLAFWPGDLRGEEGWGWDGTYAATMVSAIRVYMLSAYSTLISLHLLKGLCVRAQYLQSPACSTYDFSA